MNRRQLSEISAFALLLGLTSFDRAWARGAAGHRCFSGEASPAQARRARETASRRAAPVTEPQPSSPVIADAPQTEIRRAAIPRREFDATQEAASEEFNTGKELNAVPYAARRGVEIAVPGLMVTQHSGEGKANQYQLRGFQLDHGTDLAITLDGMPLNMPTHGHGQGYADTNFLIPELFSLRSSEKRAIFRRRGRLLRRRRGAYSISSTASRRPVFRHRGQLRLWPSAWHNLEQARGRQSSKRRGAWHIQWSVDHSRRDAQDQRRACAGRRARRKTASQSPAWPTPTTGMRRTRFPSAP